MVSFPNCKINLGLNITGKRTDGYHDLETVFYPINFTDAIEIIENSTFQFSVSGLSVGGPLEDNLCVKAWHLLKKDFPGLPPVHMHLHKAIPIGAGLGGGSADGAFALKLLTKKFELGLSDEALMDYSLRLGSDCPFFILNKPCLAVGRGEILKEINPDLHNYKIVIVYPGIHVSTPGAFANINPHKPTTSVKEIILRPIDSWKHELTNDFEEPVFKMHPEIKKIKEDLYNAGAVYSSMSGSGSSVYGIFEKGKRLSISFAKEYFVKEIER